MPQYVDLYEHQFKYGRNSDVDTGVGLPEDIWDGGGAYAWPTAAAETTIVSSDAADAAAGTGARTVYVEGLDSDYLIVSETATLNGTNAVTLTNQYLRVYRAYVVTAGSGTVNAGNVQVKHGATVLAQITAEYGQTLMAVYTVPADYTAAWLAKWSVTITKKSVTTNATIALQMRPYGGAWLTKENIGVSNVTGDFSYEYLQWLRVAPKTDIRIRAIDVSANDTDISARFEMLLDR